MSSDADEKSFGASLYGRLTDPFTAYVWMEDQMNADFGRFNGVKGTPKEKALRLIGQEAIVVDFGKTVGYLWENGKLGARDIGAWLIRENDNFLHGGLGYSEAPITVLWRGLGREALREETIGRIVWAAQMEDWLPSKPDSGVVARLILSA